MSARDSWDQAMESRAPGQGGDLGAQFRRMNVNATSFVPNAQAPTFVPYGSQYGYPVPGHHPLHGGMYAPPPPGMQIGGHMTGQANWGIPSWGHLPPVPHGMAIPQHRPVPGHESDRPHMSVPPNTHPHPPYPPSTTTAKPPSIDLDINQRHTQINSSTHDKKTGGSVGANNFHPPTVDPSGGEKQNILFDNPVDSWEDMADDPPNPILPPSTSSSSSSLLTTQKTDIETKMHSPLSGQSIPKVQEPPSKKGAVCVGVEGAKVERKQPSLGGAGDRTPSSSRGEGGSGGGKGSKSSHPPPKREDEKDNVNIVFIGHVDAGKSTIGGHLLYLTGQVDKRTLDKYEREAKEKNRETWYLSWALDTNQEERDKGKTVEVGRASFETGKKRFTVLDAPGHAGFVPNMISGAAQADIGVLVISARKGEFETGFERRGQTREHAMLAKTAGVKHLVVLINKMDDPTVLWDEGRYEECKTKLTPFLKKVGFNPKTDLVFIPVSGLTGANIRDIAIAEVCAWYRGPPFISYLNDLPPLVREDTGPCRMPISDKYKDMGTMVMGKVESGSVVKGIPLTLMPNKVLVEVISIQRNEEEVPAAFSGDNVRLKLKGVEEEDLSSGFVLCDSDSLCHVGSTFDAQIVILEHKSIICAGYSAVLHIHSVVEEVQIKQLMALIDRKTGKKAAQRPRFVKQDQVVIARLQTAGVICLETFKEFPQMARFTLRDEGKTIAIGKVLKLID